MNLSRRQLLIDSAVLGLGTSPPGPAFSQTLSNRAVHLIIAQAAATPDPPRLNGQTDIRDWLIDSSGLSGQERVRG